LFIIYTVNKISW